jgi:AbrB family looped-hinge helix DNA binding protein
MSNARSDRPASGPDAWSGALRPSRMSPNGRVTVPKSVRDHLGLDAGSSVEFEVTGGGVVVVRKRTDRVPPLRGALSAYAPGSGAISTEEIDSEIAREAARLDARSMGDDAGSDG